MQVLLADDDKKLLAFLAKGLRQEGHLPTCAHDGREAFDQLSTRTFDVAVLDIMMPAMDGLSVIRSLRDNGVATPVLVLSAKRAVSDRVLGLRSGGDDYLVKPFAFTELLARLESLQRRFSGTRETIEYVYGDFSLNVVKREVTRGGKRIDLQPKEYALLEYLVRNAERVVSKTMIMQDVWGYDFDPQTNVVESRMSHLRDRIERNFETPLIHTVRGAGYVFRVEPISSR